MCIFHKWGEWAEERTESRRHDNWDITVDVWGKRICKKCKKEQWQFVDSYLKK